MFDSVFSLVYKNCLPNEDLSSFLQQKTSQDITEFGIPDLPSQLKFEIEVLTYDCFAKKLSKTNLPLPTSQHCISYVDNSVHCVDYASVPFTMSRESYLKAVRHECIHVLQLLATRISPQSAVWLYESVACARAEQQLPKPSVVPSWFEFVTNFYTLPDCYALAFRFGTGLLNRISMGEVVARCDDLSSFKGQCKKIYYEVFSK